MPILKQDILDRLRTVQDPEIHRDLVTLNAVQNISFESGVVEVELKPTSPDPGVRQTIVRDATAAIRSLGDEVQQVSIRFQDQSQDAPTSSPQGDASKTAEDDNPLPQVKNIIAVGAGKGGVGKSTVAVNLAVGLSRLGQRVGILDADIYGPSLPTMLGLNDLQPTGQGNTINPFEIHGLQAMSLGALVDADKALIWRGPMAHGAFRQLVTQTNWPELDTLIIDLPPGTGDVPLTMSQTVPLTGAVVVCTPQKVAQDDARRAAAMFNQLNIDVLGLVENMSYFIGDDGKEYDLFGKGGAQMLAQNLGLPFLGNIPINTALRRNGDAGTPLANFEDPQLASEMDFVTKQLQQQIAIKNATISLPTLSIS